MQGIVSEVLEITLEEWEQERLAFPCASQHENSTESEESDTI